MSTDGRGRRGWSDRQDADVAEAMVVMGPGRRDLRSATGSRLLRDGSAH
jgi:hypothetical protein